MRKLENTDLNSVHGGFGFIEAVNGLSFHTAAGAVVGASIPMYVAGVQWSHPVALSAGYLGYFAAYVLETFDINLQIDMGSKLIWM